MSAEAELQFTGTPRRAPAAAGTGIPKDRHEAYRRGLCVDCFTAWQSPGRTRCNDCHDVYTRGACKPTLTAVPGGQTTAGPWRPRPQLAWVKTA